MRFSLRKKRGGAGRARGPITAARIHAKTANREKEKKIRNNAFKGLAALSRTLDPPNRTRQSDSASSDHSQGSALNLSFYTDQYLRGDQSPGRKGRKGGRHRIKTKRTRKSNHKRNPRKKTYRKWN